MLVGHPLFDAAFSGDDWGLASMAAQLASPWRAYVEDHSFSYFYRPHGIALWWASVQAFALEPAAHYGLNLALHAANAILVARLVRGTGVPAWLAGVLALAWAVHPAVIGTTAWLADRFDLLATFGVLGALVAATRALGTAAAAPRKSSFASGLVGVFVFAIVAAGSKETAIVLLPAIAVLAWLHPGERSGWWRIGLVSMAAVPFALMLIARALLLSDLAQAVMRGRVVEIFAGGTLAWLEAFPALLVRNANVPVDLAIGFVLIAFVGVATARALAGLRARSIVAAHAGVGLVLLLAPGVVQAPVAGYVFADPAALGVTVNGRFFYLAYAGLAIVIAAALAPCTAEPVGERRRLAMLATSYLVGIATLGSAVASWRTADTWATSTRHAAEVVEAARAAFATVEPGERCQVRFEGGGTEFAGFADVAIKAALADDDPRRACLVKSDVGPYFAHLPTARCDDADEPGLARTVGRDRLTPRTFANVCIAFPDPEAAVVDAARFRWDDATRRFVPAAATTGG